jgi:hypothetical protein
MRALNRLRDQQDRPFRVRPFAYDAVYRELIHRRLLQGFMDRDYEVSPNEVVAGHFGISLEEELDPLYFGIPLEDDVSPKFNLPLEDARELKGLSF